MVYEAFEKSALTNNFKLELLPRQSVKSVENIPAFIQRENKKLERIKDAYENGVYSLDEFKESRQQIQNRIAELEQKLNCTEIPDEAEQRRKIHKQIIELLPTLKSPAVPEVTKNSLLKSFVKRIVFYRPSCDIDIFFYA